MQLIAHRGLTNDNIKENTLESFKNAIDNGYDGIELDVRLTKDKKIVVLHDKLINRTSDGIGNINKLMYKDVLKYNFGSKKRWSKIPLLKDVIESISNKIIIIELKEKIELNDLEDILKLNLSNDYYISSFNKEYIDYIKNLPFKKGLINYVFNSMVDLKMYDFVFILESLFNREIYDYLKKIDVESIIYNTQNNISLKNKEIMNDLKYII